MNAFNKTDIWLRTLAEQSKRDGEKTPREQLRAAFLRFRERAGIMAGEIVRDLPDFTVHDASHLDSLWQMASLLAGLEFPINPAEAFVLGGAFLIHDLGNGLAAYPEGVAVLRSSIAYRDTVANILRRELGRTPSEREVNAPTKEIETAATSEVLRQLHAKHAERLALISWTDSDSGMEHFLIEDVFLRKTYGHIIGKIAHSHWWSVDRLAKEFEYVLGAPSILPAGWSVDPLKIACLFRVSDASHIDSSRAPLFLKTLRKPVAESRQHWLFQEKIHQPILSGDRLLYTSGEPFKLPDAPAWWICFDTVGMIDKELRQVDSLLNDSNRPRLAARAVQGAEGPEQLAKWIPVEGWIPVDARLKVTNVAALAKTLGGEQLYGKNALVPLRELVQNASDAVRARRYLEETQTDDRRVIVRLGRDPSGHWIEVEDNGVGMSAAVLAGPLLQFGTSYWGSSLMLHELPGLSSSSFYSTGKFGIGFFSVFMWSDRVRVTSRPYREAQRDTHVLEFNGGLTTRPILRRATEAEHLRDGGTTIRVWVQSPPEEAGGVLNLGSQTTSAEELCESLFPALDVNLDFQRNNSPAKRLIATSDWQIMEPVDLIRRIQSADLDGTHAPKRGRTGSEQANKIATRLLRALYDSAGHLVGRAAIVPGLRRRYEWRSMGVVTAGGIHACALNGIAGVLVGNPQTASREIAAPVVEKSKLAEWASTQALLLSRESVSPELLAECAGYIAVCGGILDGLPVAFTRRGWVTVEQIRSWRPMPDEVLILQDAALSNLEGKVGPVTLVENVLTIDVGKPSLLQVNYSSLRKRWFEWPDDDDGEGYWSFHNRTVEGAIVRTLAEAWSSTPDEVVAVSKIPDDERSFRRIIGTASGKKVSHSVNIFRNPKKFSAKGGRF